MVRLATVDLRVARCLPAGQTKGLWHVAVETTDAIEQAAFHGPEIHHDLGVATALAATALQDVARERQVSEFVVFEGAVQRFLEDRAGLRISAASAAKVMKLVGQIPGLTTWPFGDNS